VIAVIVLVEKCFHLMSAHSDSGSVQVCRSEIQSGPKISMFIVAM